MRVAKARKCDVTGAKYNKDMEQESILKRIEMCQYLVRACGV